MSVITKQDIDKARDSLFKPAADSSGYDVIWITQDQFAGLKKVFSYMEARIAEMEAALGKAALYLYEATGSCPSDLYDWEHPNTCACECAKYDNAAEAWKCWRLWLMCPAPPEEK